MAKKINVTYFDDFNFNFDEYKNLYMELEEISDPNEIDDNDIYAYISDSQNEWFKDLMDNIFYSKNNDAYWCISGSLGLWVGRRGIEPVVCDDLISAIKKCINGCDYCTIKQVNGHLEIDAYHHDGRNTFEINLLNDKGVDAYYRIKEGWGRANLADRHYHKSLGGYLF